MLTCEGARWLGSKCALTCWMRIISHMSFQAQRHCGTELVFLSLTSSQIGIERRTPCRWAVADPGLLFDEVGPTFHTLDDTELVLRCFAFVSSRLFFFSLKHFGQFLLRHFDHWNISVICLKVVWKLAVTVLFIRRYFQTFWPKWLNFFRLFQITLVYDRKKNRFQDKFLFTGQLLAPRSSVFNPPWRHTFHRRALVTWFQRTVAVKGTLRSSGECVFYRFWADVTIPVVSTRRRF